MPGKGLLRNWSKPWPYKRKVDMGWQPIIYNIETEAIVNIAEDPRLGLVHDGWERLENDGPKRMQKWKTTRLGR